MVERLTQAWRALIGEKRSAGIGIETDSPQLRRLFGYSLSGTAVNEQTAMKLSAVYGCVKILSESIAKLPLHVYQRTDNVRQVAAGHPVHRMLHTEPNEYMTSFAFRQAIMQIALLYGNGFARIVRDGYSRPKSLKLYGPGEVHLIESKGQLFAQTPEGLIPYYDIFHLRGLGTGIMGVSPIRYAAESMGITLSAQTFGKNFFENGAHVGGVLEHPGKLSDTAFKHLKESWNADAAGLNNVAKPRIIEEGMKWNKITLPPNEAQFIETRQFGTTDICRWFGVQSHKVFDLTKATFSNIEQQNIEFVQDGLMPWCVRFEQEADRKLFRETEKAAFYTKFSLNALMRGDSAARAAFYKELFTVGALSQNDIRELEDQNPIPGGDRYYVQGNNMVPIDKIDEFLAAKNAKTPPKQQENGE